MSGPSAAAPAARRRPSRRRRPPRAVGAIAAQFSQALGSFVLQLLAARTLGLEEFGVFALLIGAIVLATGIMTGFVGDSLTVLDRGAPGVRAALQIWCLTIALITLAVGTVVAERTGLVSLPLALLFGSTMAVWVLEDTVRRLLMATLRFWSVVTVDLVHVGTAVTWLGVAWWAHGVLTLADFMLALLLGQAVAVLVGLCRVPREERGGVTWRGAALTAVARFGAWRGLQQGIRPATLTVARVLVAVVAGSAAVGQLEAARVYTAPALLFVQGVGSFLLAQYAADRRAPVGVALHKADRAVLALLGASVVLGAAATVLVPWLGPLVTGGGYALDAVAVAGWATIAAAVATVMPYASLAAVRGAQSSVVLFRAIDATLSIGAVAVVLWLGAQTAVVPFAVAGGALVGAAFQRMVVLRTDGAAEGG